MICGHVRLMTPPFGAPFTEHRNLSPASEGGQKPAKGVFLSMASMVKFHPVLILILVGSCGLERGSAGCRLGYLGWDFGIPKARLAGSVAALATYNQDAGLDGELRPFFSPDLW